MSVAAKKKEIEEQELSGASRNCQEMSRAAENCHKLPRAANTVKVGDSTVHKLTQTNPN